jgi:hypothetical protein
MKLYAIKDYQLHKGKDFRDLQELLERSNGRITNLDLRGMYVKYACPEISE